MFHSSVTRVIETFFLPVIILETYIGDVKIYVRIYTYELNKNLNVSFFSQNSPVVNFMVNLSAIIRLILAHRMMDEQTEEI
jgi:hypothetical protein